MHDTACRLPRIPQRVEKVVVGPVSGPRDPETRPKRYENEVFGP